MDYMFARYYGSKDHFRFLSVDPGNDTRARDPKSWNLYSYVRNNPLSRRDPDGRKADEAEEEVKKAAQGAAIHAGASATNDAAVRGQYIDETGKLVERDGAGRSALKSAARDKTSTTGRILSEAMRPEAAESARTGGTANKTNPKVNKAMKTAGRLGKGLLVLGAAGSAYEIATAPEGEMAREAAGEAGAWAGALSGGALGAKTGAFIGAFGGPPGAAAGAVIGGLLGAAGGAILGESAAETAYDAVIDE